MAYTLDFALSLGAGNSGLTLEAQIVNTAGSNVGSAITTGFVEFGSSGNYLWHTAAMPDSHQGGVVFQISGGGAVKAFAAVNPQETEFSDLKTSTRLASATVLSELAQATPAATPTVEQALMLLYMALRDQLDTTASLVTIRNNAGTVIAKATLSDNGTTFTRGQLVSGP